VVVDGRFISGGGVTAGIDMALKLTAELLDREQAEAIQLNLEYAPAPPFAARRPEAAPREVVARVRAAASATRQERERIVQRLEASSAG
jgi:cyclohexyl-isocyanide hydratase